MKDWAWFAIGVALLGGIVWYYADANGECSRKGGTLYCGYKSSCVCLAPGVVIP